MELTHAAPRSPARGVAPSVACASCPRARRRVCGLPHRAPRPRAPFYFVLPHDPARAAVVASHHLRCCGAFDIGRTLLRPPQWISQTSSVPNGRGHLDLLRGSRRSSRPPLTLSLLQPTRGGRRWRVKRQLPRRKTTEVTRLTSAPPPAPRGETTTYVRSGQGSVDRAAQKFVTSLNFIPTPLKRAEIRVVLRGVPKEIPVDEVKEDLVAQKPSGSVGAPNTEPIPNPRLVLVSGTEANDKAKPPSSKSGRMLPLRRQSGAARKRALPGQCTTASPTGTRPVTAIILRCVKCLGDHGTAQCTRNKDTDGPPACVLCKQKGHTANYLGCPRAPKTLHPRGRAARGLRAQSRRHSAMLERRLDRVTPRPPQRTLLHPLTIWSADVNNHRY
ncbi:hypothetical protein EVAR_85392_1 [Eumeta japonica]|uniref:Nucleic-acid-binding protein from transposon X-element n=1 Tax=Eumeta variegata TaxID=151549 RepID=A0A4C1SK46_EUMVA|nr:hypothetical protein EVAR_85392_1 [Eumeta japonica]